MTGLTIGLITYTLIAVCVLVGIAILNLHEEMDGNEHTVPSARVHLVIGVFWLPLACWYFTRGAWMVVYIFSVGFIDFAKRVYKGE